MRCYHLHANIQLNPLMYRSGHTRLEVKLIGDIVGTLAAVQEVSYSAPTHLGKILGTCYVHMSCTYFTYSTHHLMPSRPWDVYRSIVLQQTIILT